MAGCPPLTWPRQVITIILATRKAGIVRAWVGVGKTGETCLIKTSVPPAALCDSNDGSNASEDRCKSPTSGKPFFIITVLCASYQRKKIIFQNKFKCCDLSYRNSLALQFWRRAKAAEFHRAGYCMESHSQRTSFTACPHGVTHLKQLMSSALSFWTPFAVKSKSRRFSKTVANDFGSV